MNSRTARRIRREAAKRKRVVESFSSSSDTSSSLWSGSESFVVKDQQPVEYLSLSGSSSSEEARATDESAKNSAADTESSLSDDTTSVSRVASQPMQRHSRRAKKNLRRSGLSNSSESGYSGQGLDEPAAPPPVREATPPPPVRKETPRAARSASCQLGSFRFEVKLVHDESSEESSDSASEQVIAEAREEEPLIVVERESPRDEVAGHNELEEREVRTIEDFLLQAEQTGDTSRFFSFFSKSSQFFLTKFAETQRSNSFELARCVANDPGYGMAAFSGDGVRAICYFCDQKLVCQHKLMFHGKRVLLCDNSCHKFFMLAVDFEKARVECVRYFAALHGEADDDTLHALRIENYQQDSAPLSAAQLQTRRQARTRKMRLFRDNLLANLDAVIDHALQVGRA